MSKQLVEDIIRPVTSLEKQITIDPDFIEGAMFGEPRPGHPEGKVIYHIEEVLRNVDKYASIFSDKTWWKLRVIALIHDTFKHKVQPRQSASGENHHAMIARRFAERYIDDTDVLDIIELHDEAYNAWCNGSRDGKWEKAEKRLERLLNRLNDHYTITLYTLFYRCDNETGENTSSYCSCCIYGGIRVCLC